METKVFLEKVKEEATTLKNGLTPAQTGKLDYSKFHPFISQLCLLGQIFGNSTSTDALDVLPKSCYIKNQQNDAETCNKIRENSAYRNTLETLEVTTESQIYGIHITYLEVYLMVAQDSSDLFQFLKGEVDEFNPTL